MPGTFMLFWPLGHVEPPGTVQCCLLMALEGGCGGHYRPGQSPKHGV